MKRLLTVFAVAGLVLAVSVAAQAVPIVIDGTVSAGEWDAFYIGQSVTAWQGGMVVDMYGFWDATDMYVMLDLDYWNSPGASSGLGVSVNAHMSWPAPDAHPAAPHNELYVGGWGPVLWYNPNSGTAVGEVHGGGWQELMSEGDWPGTPPDEPELAWGYWVMELKVPWSNLSGAMIPKPGDTEQDWDVDGVDLATFGLNWDPGGTIPSNDWNNGDFDDDGDVDGVDLAALGLNWSPGGYTPDVPVAPTTGQKVEVGGQFWGYDFATPAGYASEGVAPAPEPATMALIGLGVVGMLIRRKRR